MTDTPPTVTCNGCGFDFANYFHPHDTAIDNGWVMKYSDFGYYSGFTDCVPEGEWHLCHDCVVKLLTVFPRLGKTFSNGEHPYTGSTPCCDWAWQ